MIQNLSGISGDTVKIGSDSGNISSPNLAREIILFGSTSHNSATDHTQFPSFLMDLDTTHQPIVPQPNPAGPPTLPLSSNILARHLTIPTMSLAETENPKPTPFLPSFTFQAHSNPPPGFPPLSPNLKPLSSDPPSVLPLQIITNQPAPTPTQPNKKRGRPLGSTNLVKSYGARK